MTLTVTDDDHATETATATITVTEPSPPTPEPTPSNVGDFEHLVIHSSIIRRAANRFITEYVERLHGKPYEPFHPAVRDLLKETYGIMVYQQNVSWLGMALADFSPEEADDLRKILTKKRDWGKFAAYRKHFEERAQNRGVSRQKLDRSGQIVLRQEC